MTRGAGSAGQKLAALSRLRERLHAPEAAHKLRAALRDSSNYVVERAAELMGDSGNPAFVDDLVRAYHRLKEAPIKTDPGCLGKIAIVQALVKLEHRDAEIFRDAVAYRQYEPVRAGEVDTAPALRAAAALGLAVSVPSLEVLNRCALLLTDPCEQAREGAAQALAVLGVPEGGPLLRLKLITGDGAPTVIGECCSALLKLDRQYGVDFVQRLLKFRNPDVCVQAALALAETRRPEIFEPLRAAWEARTENAVRESLLICIGLLRTVEAEAFLLALIGSRDQHAAADAIRALTSRRNDAELRAKIEVAVGATGNAKLAAVFHEEWGRA